MSSEPPFQPAAARLHVHKFGGSSLANAERYRAVAKLIDDGATTRVVVVSAMQGVTDALIALLTAAWDGGDWQPQWAALRTRHLDTAAGLDGDHRHQLQSVVDVEFSALRGDLEALADGSGDADAIAQRVPGLGEVLSSHLLHAALGGNNAGWRRLDAREVLVAHPGELGMAVDWDASRQNLAAWRGAMHTGNVVVTGFVARDAQGRATTLGRNGSDCSAAIFSNLFEADALTIWTDVDGVLSADPRRVPDAVCLPSMSYAEACELAYFGAKVLHPQTLAPAMQRGLPIRIRNTLNPAAPGTVIALESQPAASPVKGLSLVEDLAILELTGAGLIGVPGTAEGRVAPRHAAGGWGWLVKQGAGAKKM